MFIRSRSLLATSVMVLVMIVGLLPVQSISAADSVSPFRIGGEQQLAQPKVIVNTSFLNVRSGPGAIYSIIGTLPGGTELPVLGRTRDASWWQVQSMFGIGWVSAEFVIPRGDFRPVPVVQATGIIEQPRVAVLVGPVNVYVLPDTNSSLLGLSLVGSELPIVGKTGDGVWWQVETNVGLGWLMQEDVFLRGNATTVPVVTGTVASDSGFIPADSAGGVMMSASGERPIAYVYSDGLAIHETPNYGATVVENLAHGDRVEVLDYSEDGEFALILYMNDRLGWIVVNDAAFSDPTDWRTQVWFNGPGVLDLKEQPSLSSTTLAMVPAGERLVVVDDADGGWLKLTHEMGTGWVRWDKIEIIRNGPYRQPGAEMAAGGSELSGAVLQPSTAALVAVVPEPVRSYLIVNTSFLNIRSGPGANYTVVQTVNGGTELDITASTPDAAWFSVAGPFGSGWVNSEFVIFRGNFDNVPIVRYADVIGQATSPEVLVSAPVNVYLGVGVETGLLGTAPAGLTMPVIGRTVDGNWFQVQTSSGPGWVLVSTVTFRGDIAQVPITG